MSAPTEADVVRLKRVLRYLKSHPRGVYLYGWQPTADTLRAQVDSDWAGCEKSRKSTSGGLIYFGTHVILHWARTQTTIALSSGEAELGGIITGVSNGLEF